MGKVEDLDKLCLTVTLHCYNCGHVLLRKSVGYMDVVQAKCVNPGCRRVNYFIFTKGRLRLITRKLLGLIDEKELWPYSKSDILKIAVK